MAQAAADRAAQAAADAEQQRVQLEQLIDERSKNGSEGGKR